METFLKEMYSDPDKILLLGKSPEVRRVKSPPSYSMAITNLEGCFSLRTQVYKKCPNLLRWLWKLLRRIWKKSNCTITLAEGRSMFCPQRERFCEDKSALTYSISTQCSMQNFFSAGEKAYYMHHQKQISKYLYAIERGPGLHRMPGAYRHHESDHPQSQVDEMQADSSLAGSGKHLLIYFPQMEQP